MTSTANNLSETINEKAVRASTAQMCRILEIAMDELKSRPLSAQPVLLTTTINIGLASLQMQVNLPPNEVKDSAKAQ